MVLGCLSNYLSKIVKETFFNTESPFHKYDSLLNRFWYIFHQCINTKQNRLRWKGINPEVHQRGHRRKGGRGLSMIVHHVACRTWKDQLSIHAFIKNEKGITVYMTAGQVLYTFTWSIVYNIDHILCPELTFDIEDIHTISFHTEYCSNAGFHVALIGQCMFSRMWQLYILRTDLNW